MMLSNKRYLFIRYHGKISKIPDHFSETMVTFHLFSPFFRNFDPVFPPFWAMQVAFLDQPSEWLVHASTGRWTPGISGFNGFNHRILFFFWTNQLGILGNSLPTRNLKHPNSWNYETMRDRQSKMRMGNWLISNCFAHRWGCDQPGSGGPRATCWSVQG